MMSALGQKRTFVISATGPLSPRKRTFGGAVASIADYMLRRTTKAWPRPSRKVYAG
jgi:hypothetical protein